MAKNKASIWKKPSKPGKRYEREMAMVEARAKRREAKEEKILSIAARFFWDKGFLGTSLDEIADKANINKASIYYYFENKVVLLYEVISRPLLQMIAEATPIVNSDARPTEKLKSLITGHIIWQLTRPGITGIGHIERKNLPPDLARKYIAMRDRYETLFRKVIEEGIKKGELFFPDTKLCAMFVLGLLTSITHWYKSKGKYSPDEIASLASNYVLTALGKKQRD